MELHKHTQLQKLSSTREKAAQRLTEVLQLQTKSKSDDLVISAGFFVNTGNDFLWSSASDSTS